MSARDDYNKINDKIKKLEDQKAKLENDKIKEDQEKLKPLIGLCFTRYVGDYTTYYKVVDVPRKHTGSEYNPYEIPVIEIYCNGLYIKRTTIFSKAVDADNPVEFFKQDLRPCTERQFNTQLNKLIKRIKEIKYE